MNKNLKKISFWKLIVFNLLACLVAAAIVLIGFEVVARHMIFKKGLFLSSIDYKKYREYAQKDYGYQFPKNFYQLDPQVGWKHTPNNQGIFRGWSYPEAEFRINVSINAQGFRSSKDYSIDEDKWRIAVLGDSVVQALQVEEDEMFTSLLEQRINDRGTPTKVYNFGVSSIGTAHEYQLFFEDVVKLKPHLVILSFIGNDLPNNSGYYKQEKPQLSPQYIENEDGSISIAPFNLSQQSQLIHYKISVREGFKKYLIEEKILLANAVLVNMFPKWHSFRLALTLLKNAMGFETHYDPYFDVYRKVYPSVLEDSLKRTIQLIKQLNDYCNKNNIDFLVALMPTREMVFDSEWEKYLKRRDSILSADYFDMRRPNNLLEAELAAALVPVIDLVPIVKKKYKGKDIFYKKDNHFNALGHQVASEILDEAIISKNLILSK